MTQPLRTTKTTSGRTTGQVANEVFLPELDTARTVLYRQVEGLKLLRDELGPTFQEAVQCLLDTTAADGRVIIAGIGKSGHVGRKIAATMASTGTPSYFVHAGEASHGDLGMITSQDTVIALSNSGETAELLDLINYTRRYGIKLIAMTSGAESTLARMADIALILPQDAEEGCTLKLAPTTSTTLTMALGDALAITLLEAQNFTATDFKAFHPGGKLGQQLLKVADRMHQNDSIPLAGKSEPMTEILVTMTEKAFGCAGVVEDSGALIGVITDGDLRRHMESLSTKAAADVMTANPKTISQDLALSEALAIMNEYKITALFVVDTDTNVPVGILHMHDCLRAGIS